MKVYGDVINNVKFEASYDVERRKLHVLDAMGGEAYKSVTNGIDTLLPVLEKMLGIKSQYKVLLYGTDRVVSEYNQTDKSFVYIPPESPSIDRKTAQKMNELYQ